MRPGVVLLQFARAEHLPGEVKHVSVLRQFSAQRHVNSWEAGVSGGWIDAGQQVRGEGLPARSTLGIGAKMA
jgi:hypothetical protein